MFVVKQGTNSRKNFKVGRGNKIGNKQHVKIAKIATIKYNVTPETSTVNKENLEQH